MSAFDKAWEVVKNDAGWANKFRQWSMENKDNEWYNSRFPDMGTEEEPIVGHNFDDWSYNVRNAIREALTETFGEGRPQEDYDAHADDFGEIIEERSWDMPDVSESTDFVIEQITAMVADLERSSR